MLLHDSQVFLMTYDYVLAWKSSYCEVVALAFKGHNFNSDGLFEVPAEFSYVHIKIPGIKK